MIDHGLNFIPCFSKIDLYLIIFNFYKSLLDLNRFSIFKLNSKESLNREFSDKIIKSNNESIIKYLNKEFPNKPSNFHALSSTKQFHSLFLKSILNRIDINNYNFNFNCFNKALKNIKRKNIIITPADKNVGIVLIESRIYLKLCKEHLLDTSIYSNISFNPHFSLFSKSRNLLTSLFSNSHISQDLYYKLSDCIRDKKLPSFRALPKVHKPKFGIRPLVNCSFSITSPISKCISFYLNKLVLKFNLILKDSQNFIQISRNFTFNKNSKIYTSDFVSLYTKIPQKKCISNIMELLTNDMSLFPKNYSDFNPYGFSSLLSLILENNYFSFSHVKEQYFFLQLSGIAMGTSCGPAVANLHLVYYELKYLHSLNVSLYHRFIDDNVFISDSLLTNEDFENIYPDLELEIQQSDVVNFLDLKIKFDLLYRLNFDLYIKPTNTFSYLLTNSNHPKFCFKNIIKTLLYRIRRTCNDLDKYYYHSSLLLYNLLKRQYPHNLVLNLIRYFSNVDRNSLIPYVEKPNNISNSLLFITSFDRFLPNHSNFLNDIWNSCLENNSNLRKTQFKIVYRNHPNLNSYFVNNKSSPFMSNRFQTCNSKSCRVCNFAITDRFLKNEKNLPILIPSNSTCDSSNCIYFISCIKCNKFYIGETGRSISKRLNEHLNKIRYAIKKSNCPILLENFLKNSKDCYILYKHFVFNHNVNQDFKFQVFTKNFIYFRNRLETDLMTIFNTYHPNGLNSIASNTLYSLENYPIPPLKN